ncbi:hypothetical protein [Propionivibrio dicarboxylicus]|uniref:Uncharacterized protein n=1 Tax=Propionivibrio dicarboxylicus TaxID=83767 RepID=A0A1G8N699_9RHOO|nr:hypothetical protein [Propionivibrio dicarboxylicus]SDI75080.1 hypothetical protein SAMN05660652_03977 [Propionivibrio dicarboxylicus]
MTSIEVQPPLRRYDERLTELWRHRQTLSRTEWEELYRLTVCILRSASFKELIPLADEKDDLIQGFFTQVVMQRAINGSTAPCHHAGALIAFFRNYVTDELRARKTRLHEIPVSELTGGNEDIDPDAFVEAYADKDKLDEASADTPEKVLREFHLTIEDVFASALTFLKRQEQWVDLYLTHNFCPDDEESEPLCHLAKRHRIASYHPRAAQLGITRKKKDVPATYSETMLGNWLSSLTEGHFDPAHLALYAAALKVLCLAVATEENAA